MGREISKPKITADISKNRDQSPFSAFMESSINATNLESKIEKLKEKHKSLEYSPLLGTAAIGIARSGQVRYMNGLSAKIPNRMLPPPKSADARIMIAALIIGAIVKFIAIEYEKYRVRCMLKEALELLKQENEKTKAMIQKIIDFSPKIDNYTKSKSRDIA